LAQSIVDRLKALGARNVRPLEGIQENMSFPLPRGLQIDWTALCKCPLNNLHAFGAHNCGASIAFAAITATLWREWPFYFVHRKKGCCRCAL